MTASTQHHWTQELLGAYAIDAVNEDERRQVEEHLEECPRCRQEVDGLRSVAAALGHAVEPLPPELWDRIAAGLPSGPLQLPALTLLESSAEAQATPPATGAKIIRPARWRVVTGAAAAAAIAAIAVLSVSLADTNNQLQSTRAALASTSAAANHSLTVSGHQVVQLSSTGGQQKAEIVLLPNGHGYIVSNSLPKLASGRTYQLWAIDGGTAISLGILGSHPGAVGFNIGNAKPSALAVSVEPSQGSVSPSAVPVAIGTV